VGRADTYQTLISSNLDRTGSSLPSEPTVGGLSLQREQSPKQAPPVELSGLSDTLTGSPPLMFVPGYKPRRNTTQSLSCPEPSGVLSDTSCRSVSTPAPPPPVLESATLPKPATTPPVRGTTGSEKPSSSLTTTQRTSIPLPRAGRGMSSRARYSRGRSRGRGRRNITNPSGAVRPN
jgi:hypothetical protein